MKMPEVGAELHEESIPDKHERWLRILIMSGLTPLYIGDEVCVSNRYIIGKNPNEGRVGKIVDLDIGLQGIFHHDYTIYQHDLSY